MFIITLEEETFTLRYPVLILYFILLDCYAKSNVALKKIFLKTVFIRQAINLCLNPVNQISV